MFNLFNNLDLFTLPNVSILLIGGIALLSLPYSLKIINPIISNFGLNQNNLDKTLETSKTFVDKGVQTSNQLFEKMVGDLYLDGFSAEETELFTQEFINRYRNNPEYVDYFNIEVVNEWVDRLSVITPRSHPSLLNSYSQGIINRNSNVTSELNFLTRLRETLEFETSLYSSSSSNSSNYNLNNLLTDLTPNLDLSYLNAFSSNIEMNAMPINYFNPHILSDLLIGVNIIT